MPAAALQSIWDLDFKPAGEVYPSPADWRDTFIYFLMVDRFDDNGNSPAYDPLHTPTGRDLNQGKVFQGGNLKGITRRLDYIKGLGANAVWLSPIFKNRSEIQGSYHGYGIQDFLQVDPRFGTLKDLQELVKQAHNKGMYVIQDIIINHTGDNWAYPGDAPYYYWKNASGPFPFGFWREADSTPGFQSNDAVWPKEFQDISFYKRRGQIRNWDDHEESINGDFLSLKELDLDKALDALIKIYKYWIAATDIDGYRMDTVKHMESSLTALFCNAIREYARYIGKQNFFLFGEIAGNDEYIQQYLGRNSRMKNTDERFPSLDAALDFPLYSKLESVIKGFINSSDLRDRYYRFRTMYADHGEAGEHFVTFVDNHDRNNRFIYNNPFWQQAVLAIGYLLTSQGVPCIYYGTEQGFDGGGDNDSFVRECMFGGKWGAFNTTGHHFFNPQNQIYKAISDIAKIRQQEPVLRYGRLYFREISGNGQDFGYPIDGNCTLAYSRILDYNEIIIAINLSGSQRNDYITVDYNLSSKGTKLVNLLNPRQNPLVTELRSLRSAVQVTLDGYQMMILKKENA